MASKAVFPVVLFGYDSSAFTQKIRLALRMRQIPYRGAGKGGAASFILVSSMMPRPILTSSFNLTYRKIPVLGIGKELYVDTSLILETIALHPLYKPSTAHPPLYPNKQTRSLGRILASHYTDRPLFRLTTGLIPQAVWESSFGADRSDLIGHRLDARKLGHKIPRNMANLDTYLSILEPLLDPQHGHKWVLGTDEPTGADISLFYQLDWGHKIARGEGVADLTAGGAPEGSDSGGEGIEVTIFNTDRYPGLLSWFHRFKSYIDSLPQVETRIERTDTSSIENAISTLDAAEQTGPVPLLPTPAPVSSLDDRNGLTKGVRVRVVPDDTGRDDPTFGTLVGLSTEEVVIVPDWIDGRPGLVDGVRVHFPRVGFVVTPLDLADGQNPEIRVTSITKKAKL